MSEYRGIDVSHWQGHIDWAKVKAAGIQFAIIKAGGSDEGLYTDPRWEENYRGAKANGIAVGAYYFVGPACITAEAGSVTRRFIRGHFLHIVFDDYRRLREPTETFFFSQST